MTDRIKDLIMRLAKTHSLTETEYAELIDGRDEDAAALLADEAVKAREPYYGKKIFVRGLIEVSNICRNNCYYCGIRRDNHNVDRYRLTADEIVECAKIGASIGFKTIVLQGGEGDAFYNDNYLCDLIRRIKEVCPGCAITLSLGERSYESYKALKAAGADRYLLRHETADKEHYEKLHPAELSFDNRMKCLRKLHELGYQVGAGMMVGSPYQTTAHLAKDLKFLEEFQPEMCGLGPFIPHHETPFKDMPAGTLELTLYLLSIVRLICPHVLLPATTALGTINPLGREMGMQAGANVIMPNLSPFSVRKKYTLYDNKTFSGSDSAQELDPLRRKMAAIGYEIVIDRGDVNKG